MLISFPSLAPVGTLALVFIIFALTGIISQRLEISPILLFILFGAILGPNAIDIIDQTRELEFLKQMGLIILLFLAGLDFQFGNLRDKVLDAVIIATPPAIVGFGLGFLLYALLPWFNFVETLVLGLILTTTSISLSISILREKLGKDTEVYHTMVLAIIISNIVMILVAGLITRSIQRGGFNSLDIIGNFVVVILFIAVVVWASKNVHLYWLNRIAEATTSSDKDTIKNQRMQFALGLLGLILLIAYLLNIDLAIAAFFAGFYVSQTTRMNQKDMVKMNALGYGLLIPIFFFAMGLQINLSYFLQFNILLKVSTILILSFIGQVTLTTISSMLANFSLKDSIYLGIGLSACSLSGGFAVLSIAQDAISSTSYSIFAAVDTISVLMTIIGLEIYDKWWSKKETAELPREEKVQQRSVDVAQD